MNRPEDSVRPGEGLTDDDTLTLDLARSVAVRANPDIHIARARLEAAQQRVLGVVALFRPTVVFNHNSLRTFHTPASRNRLNTLLQPAQPVPTDIDTRNLAITTLVNALRLPLFGGQASGNANPFSEHSTSFGVTWLVLDGLVREAQLVSARHLHRAARESVADAERLITRAVDIAYYRVQLAAEQVRIAAADEEFSREQLDETEKLRLAGRASRADVDNFSVRALAAQASLIAARGERETGIVVLAELMGIADVTLPENLKLSPLADESAREMTEPDAAWWLQQALGRRPDLAQLEAILQSETAAIRAARGAFSPTLSVSGSWGFDRSSNLRYRIDDQSSAAGMELRWELYTGGARRARLGQADAARAEAAAALHRQRLAVQAEVRQAVIDVRNAQEQIRLQRETLNTARENRRIIRAGYLAGKETLTRLNEAQRDYIEADANLTLARIRLRQAWSDLYTAAGNYGSERIEPDPPGP